MSPLAGDAHVKGSRLRSIGRAFVIVACAAVACLLMIQHPAAAAAEPGTLIEQTPIAGAPDGAAAWRIRYWSKAESGLPVEITGVVIVPTIPAPAGGRGIVAWAHSTVGIASACAPSTSATLYADIASLSALLKAGYVVTATDFQGLGTPGPQPYLVGISSGRAVLDSIRAAHALKPAEAGLRAVIWGESQGAHAVLWAGQLAPAYAPEVRVLGLVADAPPTDLVANFARIENPAVRALMTGYTSATWSKIYGIPLSTFSNVSGRIFIRLLARQCVRVDPIFSASLVGLLVMSRQLPTQLGKPWMKPLRDNSVAPTPLTMPLLIAQGTADPVVIASVTREFAAKSCRAGNVVLYLSIRGGGHTTIAQDSAQTTLSWIADRFSGKPAQTTCENLASLP